MAIETFYNKNRKLLHNKETMIYLKLSNCNVDFQNYDNKIFAWLHLNNFENIRAIHDLQRL
ncbi:hypothetical protein CJI54_04220 [Bifidobacteriaceae bacterium NR026]|uniref:Uncharacterized protein n=1 Tax=Gardnerella pickettii JCP8017A TaxID=1261062 RepID=T2PMF2_9BIFI|nr:hypothetical protein HMPREF1577_00013 [Gardnerella pickettii JCP8017A]EPI62250.1 hypothetical protein HMPREF1578_00187 [Gardnerella pickettii JCP8017B]KXA16976.1 hypothetical protein HMPREF3204_00265 [Gardnerella pickettii]RIY19275.1 hypothetical protein CJI54_04220 [Bifidobacteriaceae bacterium NR026]